MSDPLAAEIAGLTPDQRRLLSQRLRRRSTGPVGEQGPVRGPESGEAPLSSAQERFWLLETLSPGAPAYTVPFAIRLHGRCDPDALDRALAALAQRHGALRTVFLPGPDQPRQRPSATAAPASRIDLTGRSPAGRAEAVDRHTVAHGGCTFDLTGRPPVSALLLRLAEEEHLLLVAVHHIVFDATSILIFAEELAAFYHAAVTGESCPLPEPPLQFADYCRWERERRSTMLAEQLPYWIDRLAAAPTLSTLPADRPRAATAASPSTGELAFTLEADVAAALSTLVRRERVTLYAALLTAFALALRRANGQDSILVGVPSSSRNHPDLQRVIGCFYNPQVLRLELAGDPTLRELLRRAHRAVGEAYTHHDVPFLDIVRAARPARSGRYNPLFQTMLSLVEIPASRWQGGGVEFTLAPSPPVATDLDLFVTVSQPADGTLRGSCRFAADLFRSETAADLIGTFQALLARLSTAPGQRAGEAAPAGSPAAAPAAAPAGRPPRGGRYRAPRNDTERILAMVWSEVLAVEQIGIDDNFFGLGGDSMQVIQVLARAAAAGLVLRPEDLVAHPTIATLATVKPVRAGGRRQRNGLVTAPVTPAQAWFLEDVAPLLRAPGHFNNAYHLELTREVPVARLADAVGRLVARHDSLRLRFDQDGGEWRQTCADPDEPVPFESHDLSTLSREEQDAAVVAIAAHTQTCLSLTRGMVRVDHFRLGPHRPDRLLLTCHHLAVDAASEPLVLASLQRIVDGAGDEVPPTASYLEWAASLPDLLHTGSLAGQLPFWREQRRREPVPVDRAGGEVRLGSRATVRRSLSAAATAGLLERARAVAVGPADLLLAAVTRAVARWQGSEHSCLAVTAPGRQAPPPAPDVSRTVGWFQFFYPLRLSAPAGPGLLAAAGAVRRQVETVPLRGLGHGLLRRSARDPSIRSELAELPAPQISFSYRGHSGVVGGIRAKELMVPIDAPVGPLQDPEGGWPYLLDIVGALTDRRLRLSVRYSPSVHDRPTVEQLADLAQEMLSEEGDDGGR